MELYQSNRLRILNFRIDPNQLSFDNLSEKIQHIICIISLHIIDNPKKYSDKQNRLSEIIIMKFRRLLLPGWKKFLSDTKNNLFKRGNIINYNEIKFFTEYFLVRFLSQNSKDYECNRKYNSQLDSIECFIVQILNSILHKRKLFGHYYKKIKVYNDAKLGEEVVDENYYPILNISVIPGKTLNNLLKYKYDYSEDKLDSKNKYKQKAGYEAKYYESYKFNNNKYIFISTKTQQIFTDTGTIYKLKKLDNEFVIKIKGIEYQLNSSIYHGGDTKGGHYVSLVVRNINGVNKFYRISDEDVTENKSHQISGYNVRFMAYVRKDVIKYYDYIPIGIPNVGNTCWANSGIQVLFNLYNFTSEL